MYVDTYVINLITFLMFFLSSTIMRLHFYYLYYPDHRCQNYNILILNVQKFHSIKLLNLLWWDKQLLLQQKLHLLPILLICENIFNSMASTIGVIFIICVFFAFAYLMCQNNNNTTGETPASLPLRFVYKFDPISFTTNYVKSVTKKAH